jgi:hypothetical protein
LPADTVITPRSLPVSCNVLCSRPRTLKLPVFWNSSAFIASEAPNSASSALDVITGVRWIRPDSPAAAWRMSSRVGMRPSLIR